MRPRPPPPERGRLPREHDAARRGDPRTAAGERAVVDAYVEVLDRLADGAAARERRPEAHAPRALVRRGGRLRERRAARRARAEPRQLHPHRHGAVRVRRADAAHLRAPAGCRPRERRHGAPVVSLPHAGRPRASAPARSRTSASSRARTWSPRRSRYPDKPDVDRAYARLVERGPRAGAYIAVGDARREHHPAHRPYAARDGHRPRPIRVPDALRRAPRAPAASSSPRATRSSSRRPTGRTGTRTSCAGSRSGPRTSASSSGTSSADERATFRRARTSSSWAAASIGYEHRLPPRRGGRRRVRARASRARLGIDEPRGGRDPCAVLGPAEHRSRPAQHRGVRALRRAARRRDRPRSRSATSSSSTARRTSRRSSGASRSRTSTACRAGS